MSDELARLQKWYAAQCEDLDDVEGNRAPWQHRYGISISTFDNPAWNIRIDLGGTALEGISMIPINIDNSETDWFLCNIIDDQFSGVGDPFKLTVILNIFFDLLQEHDARIVSFVKPRRE